MAVNAATLGGNERLKTEGNTRKRGLETISVFMWKKRYLSCGCRQNLNMAYFYCSLKGMPWLTSVKLAVG